MHRITNIVFATMALPLLAACSSDSPTEANATVLSAVSPAGGAVGVGVAGVVTVSFNHAIMAGMEQYAALHEGDVTGPVVAGSWALSTDRARLTFTPAANLKPKTQYTVHLGGGMKDAQGHVVNMSQGLMMGGQYASASMMTGGGMMQGNSSMMGTGWLATNGTFGMVFSFTTN